MGGYCFVCSAVFDVLALSGIGCRHRIELPVADCSHGRVVRECLFKTNVTLEKGKLMFFIAEINSFYYVDKSITRTLNRRSDV